MKKLILIAILSLGAISCEQKKATTEKTSIPLTYSNLVDTATQEEVQKALIAAGIAEQNVASFLESVALFNQTVGDKAGLVPKGFVTIDSLLPKYDEVAIQNIWTAKYPMFQGYNCRLTSFTLLRDLITFPADKKFASKEEDEVLFIDRESLHNTPKKFFTPEENTLFVGHVGVLVPFKGKLLFIEKLAFQEPYQAIKFANRTQLSDYLMNRYDVEWEQPNAIPFIMENDALMEGYRPNPYKKEQRL